jgi:hypothetical protein
VEALKSSDHTFKVVLQLNNGREVASRPIDLLYYRPSWFKKYDEGDAGNDGLRISNRDLVGTELRRLQTDDSDACGKACDEQSACLGYSLNRNAKVCSLKSSVTAERLDIDYEFVLKKGRPEPPELATAKTLEVHQGTSLGDPAYLVEIDSSAADCERRCMADAECVAFDFGSEKRLCGLLPSASESRSDPKSVSGIKHQPNP